MKKTIVTISSIALCLSALSAQQQYKSELTVHAGIGASTFKFSSPLLATDYEHAGAGFAGHLGADYTCFFFSDFGASIGVEAALHSGSMAVSNFVEKQQVPTPWGVLPGDEAGTDYGNFFHYTHYEGIKENRLALLLQIPVMLHYQMPLTKVIQCATHDKDFFYAAAGVKVAIPLMASYTQTVASKALAGYSEETDLFYNNLPPYGYGRFTNVPQTSADITLNSTYIIPAFELGYKKKLKAENRALYIGLYLDVGYSAGIKAAYTFGMGRKLKADPYAADSKFLFGGVKATDEKKPAEQKKGIKTEPKEPTKPKEAD